MEQLASCHIALTLFSFGGEQDAGSQVCHLGVMFYVPEPEQTAASDAIMIRMGVECA
jgi:hypothetical protein